MIVAATSQLTLVPRDHLMMVNRGNHPNTRYMVNWCSTLWTESSITLGKETHLELEGPTFYCKFVGHIYHKL